jgi:hypothetical protein
MNNTNLYDSNCYPSKSRKIQLTLSFTYCKTHPPSNTPLTSHSINPANSWATTLPPNSTHKSSLPAPLPPLKPSNPTPTSTTRNSTKTPPPPSQAPPRETYIQDSGTQGRVRRPMSCATRTRRAEADSLDWQIVLDRAMWVV